MIISDTQSDGSQSRLSSLQRPQDQQEDRRFLRAIVMKPNGKISVSSQRKSCKQNNYKEEHGMMSTKMMTMIMLRSGGGEEMMETGRPVVICVRVVKDQKSGNEFDVNELRDEEDLSPAKKKHYSRHTNSQIQANGSSPASSPAIVLTTAATNYPRLPRSCPVR
ncbi:Uncharacterized protein Rs2_09593 [Raphanus sativus]|nr:Uncharacterized protein Rs2_09593 [Raphanus sativus]